MAKRALIMYFTMTGNTVKVADRFQEVFKGRGWEYDVLKVDKKTNVIQSPSPYDCKKYDFFCIGSGSYKSLPGEPLIDMMRNNPQNIHYDPRIETGEGFIAGSGPGGVAGQFGPEMRPDQTPVLMSGPPPSIGHRKLVITPEWQKGIAFLTFGGHEFGWEEAVPALEILALEMAHMKIQCIGKFSCPGRFGPKNDAGWFKDLHTRPNERDLLSAEIFLERALDDAE